MAALMVVSGGVEKDRADSIADKIEKILKDEGFGGYFFAIGETQRTGVSVVSRWGGTSDDGVAGVICEVENFVNEFCEEKIVAE